MHVRPNGRLQFLPEAASGLVTVQTGELLARPWHAQKSLSEILVQERRNGNGAKNGFKIQTVVLILYHLAQFLPGDRPFPDMRLRDQVIDNLVF